MITTEVNKKRELVFWLVCSLGVSLSDFARDYFISTYVIKDEESFFYRNISFYSFTNIIIKILLIAENVPYSVDKDFVSRYTFDII